ncbi:putative cytochrome P450 [Massariosphaeria phaeospora]|uniref:Putative cytochrome P450 n=1 Tax=Massariosphaeria phaeospora TaxID=100035 RepID=A0A7C8IBQ1_9PLEO|nr:putative cytochrome P450 [Massariosphaeria phaeospora]
MDFLVLPPALINDLLGRLDGISFTHILAASLFALYVCSSLRSYFGAKAPFAGYRSWFEPTFWLRIRFLSDPAPILNDGYRKNKNGMFIVRRMDADIWVLPKDYLDELRLLPNTILSNAHAQFKNIKGQYTYASVVLHSNLHTSVLQNQLTPKLAVYGERSKAEFDATFSQDFPHRDGWHEVDIQNTFRTVVARMTGVTFVGHPACQNEKWLKLSVQYPLDTFQTGFTLRMFPTFTHPVLARLLPSRYRIRSKLKQAQKILEPLIREYQKKPKGAASSDGTLLAWMVENSTGTEAEPAEMTNRLMVLTLASIHTTALAMSYALFDLCAHPEYFAPLREEIEDIHRTYPGDEFIHQGLSKFDKLDSFLTESQRFHPAVLMAPQRLALKPITLKNGAHIPQGTRIGFPNNSILMDPAITPNPETFDAFRSYRMRQEPGEEQRHLWTSTDKNHLAFGHGKQACPGRHFAASEMKIVLSRLLRDYDFEFPPGKGRPRTFFLDENVFPDPAARIMMKRRA